MPTPLYPRPFFYNNGERQAGDIAQLARAAALQAVGRGFESHYLHEAEDRVVVRP
jgi:ribosomal protein S18 acetylase RimI-like enzyme